MIEIGFELTTVVRRWKGIVGRTRLGCERAQRQKETTRTETHETQMLCFADAVSAKALPLLFWQFPNLPNMTRTSAKDHYAMNQTLHT